MSTIKYFSPVTYFSGVSQFSQKSAALVWTENDTLILDLVDENNTPTQRVFETPISGLVVGGSGAMLTFLVDGTRYRIDFSFGARLAMVAGGAVGLGASNALVNQSGVSGWLEGLKASGAVSKYLTMGKLVGISFAAVGIILVVCVVGIVVAGIFTH